MRKLCDDEHPDFDRRLADFAVDAHPCPI